MSGDGLVVEPRPNRLSANSLPRSVGWLDANRCHRLMAISRVTAIGQVRPTFTPGCCHGKRPISSGREEKSPCPVGMKGAANGSSILANPGH